MSSMGRIGKQSGNKKSGTRHTHTHKKKNLPQSLFLTLGCGPITHIHTQALCRTQNHLNILVTRTHKGNTRKELLYLIGATYGMND